MIVESEIKLPELIRVFKTDKYSKNVKVDVTIQYADMTNKIEQEINQGVYVGNLNDEFWFAIKNVGIYRICGGNKIFIEQKGGSEQNIRTFLLGSAFGCLLIQRNIVAIHGGTILVNNKGLIITGDTGAGKSTLASAFRINGYKFLADDVSATDINCYGDIIVNPAYPQQKLCKDAAIKFGLKISELIKIDEDREKYVIPSHTNFIDEPRRLCYIAEVKIKENEIKNDDRVTIEEVTGVEKLNLIMKNIYRIEIANMIGIEGKYFSKIVNIAKQINYYRIIRPKNSFTVNEQIKLIISQIGA